MKTSNRLSVPPKKMSLEARVQHLPAPCPGQRLSIPIELFPYWLAYHHREIVLVDHRSFPPVMIGQRIPKETSS